jgi:citrate synthase
MVYRRDTPPVVMCMAGLTAFMAEQPNLIPSYVGKNLYHGNTKFADEQIIRTLAVSAVIVSLAFCHQKGRPFQEADPEAPFIENLLRMGGFTEDPSTSVDPKKVEILQRLWVLYADHEMTNSTAAFLHVASSLADPLSATIACVASGYGPLHGGAIDTAYKAMRDVGSPENVPNLIERVKRKEIRLFGYGHRIYRTVDPRSRFIREMLDDLTKGDLAEKMDPVLAIAMEIDRIASADEYFTSRKLQANADLFGSFVYTAL